MPDEQGPLLGKSETEETEQNRSRRWLLVAISAALAVTSQSAGILLVRFYYAEGGSSKWLITLSQTAAFPLLFFVPKQRGSRVDRPSIPALASTYFVLGALFGGSNALFSTGLSYLSASTYSLLCSTQLAFIALFSRFINSQNLTPLILNSVALLSLSASLVGVDDNDSSGPSSSGWERFIGVCSTVTASAMYSLMFSLTQLAFQRVFAARESFSVVVEMQAYVSLVATFGSLFGLFASGDWSSLGAEMDGFGGGRVSYALTLVFTALTWQVYFVCSTGLIFLVSSLFSSVISTLSLVVNPIAAVIVFRDGFGAVKVVAFLTAVWGFASYVYQNYLDESNGDISNSDDFDESPSGSSR